MAVLPEWVRVLPKLGGPGSEAFVLARGHSRSGILVRIVICIQDGRLRLGCIKGEYPYSISVIGPDDEVVPEPKGAIYESYASISLSILGGFAQAAYPDIWPYELDELVTEVAGAFVRAHLIDASRWEEQARGELLAYPAEPPAFEPAALETSVAQYLKFYLGCLLEHDDPRQYVTGLARQGDKVRLAIRSDVFPDWDDVGRYGAIVRRLRAVLHGVKVLHEYSISGEVVLRRGSFSRKVWEGLSASEINTYLRGLPNDPVERVVRGSYPLQALLVLAFKPDAEEKATIHTALGVAVTRVRRARPRWLYGPNVLSLAVPELDLCEEATIEAIHTRARARLAFFQ